MENASKALLMAGGMLIALLVIGALILMFNQLSYYQKTNSNNQKTSQLSDFNKEYVQYTYDDVKGYELISLINKVINYNTKSTGVGNSVNYDNKITVTVNITTGFEAKAGTTLQIFKKGIYNIIDKNNTFVNAINLFTGLEKEYTIGTLSLLSANYDEIKSGAKNLKEVTGKDNLNITIGQIEQYREYSEFKSSTFKCSTQPTYYDNGQIKTMAFTFVK